MDATESIPPRTQFEESWGPLSPMDRTRTSWPPLAQSDPCKAGKLPLPGGGPPGDWPVSKGVGKSTKNRVEVAD